MGDLPHSERALGPLLLFNHYSLKGLYPLLILLFDLDIYSDRISRSKLFLYNHSPLISLNSLLSSLDNLIPCNKSGLFSKVILKASFLLQLAKCRLPTHPNLLVAFYPMMESHLPLLDLQPTKLRLQITNHLV